jgi:hypothetical protein
MTAAHTFRGLRPGNASGGALATRPGRGFISLRAWSWHGCRRPTPPCRARGSSHKTTWLRLAPAVGWCIKPTGLG